MGHVAEVSDATWIMVFSLENSSFKTLQACGIVNVPGWSVTCLLLNGRIMFAYAKEDSICSYDGQHMLSFTID